MNYDPWEVVVFVAPFSMIGTVIGAMATANGSTWGIPVVAVAGLLFIIGLFGWLTDRGP